MSRPGGRGTFSLRRQRKVPKRKATLLSVSLRFASGSLRCSRAGRAAELTTRCALRSNNCCKSEVEVGGVLRHPQPSRALRSSARTQGLWKPKNKNQTSTRAIAALGPVLAPSPPGEGWNGAPTGGRAQRWPVGFPKPLWMPQRRLPLRAAKGSQTAGRAIFGDFFWPKKVTALPGAYPGTRPMPRGTNEATATSPPFDSGCSDTTKFSCQIGP